MQKEDINDWAYRLNYKNILCAFTTPKTPTRVKDELGINKFNLKPFLKRGLLKCLNPNVKKGRLYILTNKAKQKLGNQTFGNEKQYDYYLIGWILASPKQRYVILKTLFQNSSKSFSEGIRIKSSNLNPCLTRISTKAILKELIDNGLADTEMEKNGRRYYWITEKGKSVYSDLENLDI